MGTILKTAAFAALLFLAGCAVIYHTDNDGGTTANAWPRFFWEQIELSADSGYIAATDGNNVGQWMSELRVFDSPPSAVFTLNGTTFTLDSSQFNLDGGTNPMFIDFDYSGQSGNSWDVFGPSGERLLMDADNLYWESRYGNKLELHNSSVTQDFVLTINPDNGTGDARIVDSRGTTTGLEYNADYSAGFTARSLVDKAYVDGLTGAGNGGIYGGSGTVGAGGNAIATINSTKYLYYSIGQLDFILFNTSPRDGAYLDGPAGPTYFYVDLANDTSYIFLDATNNRFYIDSTGFLFERTGVGDLFEILEDGSLTAAQYGSGSISGTGTFDLGVDTNGKIIENGDYGSASGTTDGSGDITVSHSLGTATIYVTATATGTTFYNVTVHTKTSTNFKIRFFNAAGSAVTSTAVTADWIAKK